MGERLNEVVIILCAILLISIILLLIGMGGGSNETPSISKMLGAVIGTGGNIKLLVPIIFIVLLLAAALAISLARNKGN